MSDPTDHWCSHCAAQEFKEQLEQECQRCMRCIWFKSDCHGSPDEHLITLGQHVVPNLLRGVRCL